MLKKISAVILTLVLCLSVMMVPVSGAAELNGTQVAYATATPLVAGTGAVGSSTKVAREDHVYHVNYQPHLY